MAAFKEPAHCKKTYPLCFKACEVLEHGHDVVHIVVHEDDTVHCLLQTVFRKEPVEGVDLVVARGDGLAQHTDLDALWNDTKWKFVLLFITVLIINDTLHHCTE